MFEFQISIGFMRPLQSKPCPQNVEKVNETDIMGCVCYVGSASVSF